MTYFKLLEELISEHGIFIDREKGSAHPKFSDKIYPVDYGYIKNTSAMDDSGIDIFIGTSEEKLNGIICTIDKLKKDSEIKVIKNCSEFEIEEILKFLNKSEFMKAVFVENDKS